MATKGYASPEAERAYERASELAVQVQDEKLRIQVLTGLRILRQVRGESLRARDVAIECLQVAINSDNPTFVVQAHVNLAHTLFTIGEFTAAKKNLELALGAYDRTQHLQHLELGGLDGGVWAHSISGWVDWAVGAMESASIHAQDAVELARSFGSPQNLEHALTGLARLHYFRREPALVRTAAAHALEISSEYGFTYRIALARSYLGWADAVEGHVVRGEALIRAAIDEMRAAGSGAHLTLYYGMLGEACMLAGRTDDGLQAVAEGLSLVESKQEGFFEAELHRLEGELNRVRGNAEQAEVCFRRALEIARRRAAAPFEARASASLMNLLKKTGSEDSAATPSSAE